MELRDCLLNSNFRLDARTKIKAIRVHPVAFIGCIAPLFLCLLIVGLIYLWMTEPWLMWQYGPEIEQETGLKINGI